MTAYIIIGVTIIVITFIIIWYNDIITKNNEINNAYGSVDAMLKKRYDLIPNLVEIVKEYANFETTVLSDITQMRSNFTVADSKKNQVALHNEMGQKLTNLMVTLENYPDLKASQNFLRLQSSWNETEEQIAASRRYFNAAVTDYNNAIQTFPSNIIADIFGFTSKKVLETEDSERNNIHAKELFKK